MSEDKAIDIDDVRAAAGRLAGVATRTPYASSRTLDRLVGGHVVAKCENLQRTGSFKFRGAYNRLSLIPPEHRHRGVIAFSSGNHGQAVALAAQLLEIPATVVMPDDAPVSKRAATEGYGAKVIPYDRTSESRDELAAQLAAELQPAAVVPPYDDPVVMAGQGTSLLELMEDGPRPDLAVVPLGGGGLGSGWAVTLRALAPQARIVGVETEGADDWALSLRAGNPVSVPPPTTIADGIRTPAPGRYAWPILSEALDDVVVVSDDAVREAVRFVVSRLKLVVEPTGAVTLAALLTGAVAASVGPLTGRTIATVFCGGNVDSAALATILAG